MKQPVRIYDVTDQILMVLITVIFSVLPIASQILIANFIREIPCRYSHLIQHPFSNIQLLKRKKTKEQIKEVETTINEPQNELSFQIN
jgi:hypothetical protein